MNTMRLPTNIGYFVCGADELEPGKSIKLTIPLEESLDDAFDAVSKQLSSDRFSVKIDCQGGAIIVTNISKGYNNLVHSLDEIRQKMPCNVDEMVFTTPMDWDWEQFERLVNKIEKPGTGFGVNESDPDSRTINVARSFID